MIAVRLASWLVLLCTPFTSCFAPGQHIIPSKWRLYDVIENSQCLSSLVANSDKDEAAINNTISSLESTFHKHSATDDMGRFDDLIDLYEVQYVLSSNKKKQSSRWEVDQVKWIGPKAIQNEKDVPTFATLQSDRTVSSRLGGGRSNQCYIS